MLTQKLAARRLARVRAVVVCTTIAAGGKFTDAATEAYINGTGSGTWDKQNNWIVSPGNVNRLPANGDDVWITRNVADPLLYDLANGPSLASLHHTDGTTFLHRQGTLTIQNEYFWGGTLEIGQAAGAAATVHTVGSTTVDGTLDIGNASAPNPPRKPPPTTATRRRWPTRRGCRKRDDRDGGS